MSDPRYPIGQFTFDGPSSEAQRAKFIDEIEQTPARYVLRSGTSRQNRSKLHIAREAGRFARSCITYPRAT
jgi:hypothetical protein